jgi:hypothetical protein
MSGNKHPAHKNNVKDAKVDKDPNVDLQTVQNKKYKGDANMAGSGYHNATKATSTEVATGVAEKDLDAGVSAVTNKFLPGFPPPNHPEYGRGNDTGLNYVNTTTDAQANAQANGESLSQKDVQEIKSKVEDANSPYIYNDKIMGMVEGEEKNDTHDYLSHNAPKENGAPVDLPAGNYATSDDGYPEAKPDEFNYRGEFQRNILLDYDGPTYHFELQMLSDDDAIAAQRHILEGKTSFDSWRPTAAKPVTIAETGSTVLNLQSCMIEAVAGPMNNQHRVTGATNFQMSFAQPLGVSFTNLIVNAAVQLGMPDGLKATYLLKLHFIGRDAKTGQDVNPIPNTERQFLINIVSVEQTVDTSGGIFNVVAVRSGDQGTYQHVYSTDRPMELSNIKTVNDMMEKLAEAINVNEIDKLAIEKAILDEYYIHIEDHAKKILADDEIVPTPGEKGEANANQYGANNGDLQEADANEGFGDQRLLRTFKIPQNTGLNRIMEFALSHSRKLQNLAKGFDENDKDPDSTDSAKIKKYKKYIFKIKADVVNIGWDMLRNEYAKEYHYTISLFPTIRPEILQGTYSKQEEAVREKINELLKPDFGEGKTRTKFRALRKRYDYLFTGMNDKVLRFDLKFNNNFFMAMHSYQNLYDNIDKSVQEEIKDAGDKLRKFKQQQSQVRAAWKAYLKSKAAKVGQVGFNATTEMASSATYNQFKKEREELISQYVGRIEDGTIEGDEGLANRLQDLDSYDKKLSENKNRVDGTKPIETVGPAGGGADARLLPQERLIGELIDENDLRNKIESGQVPTHVMWGVTRDASAGNFNDEGHPENKGKHQFDAVMQASLSDFQADMVQMDMDIRGDMYWLESEGDPRAITSSYYAGENYLLFRAITSAGEPDINTGIATPGDTKKEQLLNGVYAVVNVTSRFEGGLFTQNIKGPRENFIYDTAILESFEEK